ncbi:MAG TPA: sigma-70 family RNA polymerase sigma factor, partial [Thermoguttaceae bacterium]|nr:sigma-70 family RNA polymerase sigma factor [Thermoguttaceae bacterium]
MIALVVSESSARRYTLADPDVRLMLQVRDDDAAAFEELVLRYQDRLVVVLEHLVGNRDQAEDLAQDVFLRVFRARGRYVAGAKFSTWLFTIANNVALNALRSRSRRHEVTLQGRDSGPMGARPLDTMAQAASGQMPTRQLDKAEMREIVRMAV